MGGQTSSLIATKGKAEYTHLIKCEHVIQEHDNEMASCCFLWHCYVAVVYAYTVFKEPWEQGVKAMNCHKFRLSLAKELVKPWAEEHLLLLLRYYSTSYIL